MAQWSGCAGHGRCCFYAGPVWLRSAGLRPRHRRDLYRLPDVDGSDGAVCAANMLHLLARPADAVAELWRLTAPGGLLILPTCLMGESSLLFRVLVLCYKLAGFRQKHQFTLDSYRLFLEKLPLPPGSYRRVEGLLPVGIAAFRKAEQ